jgi:hypothetical protein
MAVLNRQRRVGYGLTDALPDIPNAPIVSQRAPSSNDKAPIGTIWVDKPLNDAYILTSIVANTATWIGAGGGSGTFSSITVDPGDITVVTGDVILDAGDITVTLGDIVVDAGDITATLGAIEAGTTVTAGTGVIATTGDITATAGNFVATAGGVDAFTSVTAGTDLIATAGDAIVLLGDVTVSVGDVVATLGAVSAGTTVTAGTGITATTGNIVASAGNVSAVALESSSGITAGTGVSITTGDLTVVAGDISASVLGSITGGTLYASADLGGVGGTTSLSNEIDSTQGVGVLSILSTNGNSAPNTGGGFLKFYQGATTIYVPYFTNIAP